MKMNRLPVTMLVALFLLALNAGFWLVYALIVALGLIPSFSTFPAFRWIMAGLAFGASGALAGLAFFLSRRNRLAFYAGCVILVVVAVLSITDEFGLPDLFTLLISLAALGLLLKNRAWYLQRSLVTAKPT